MVEKLNGNAQSAQDCLEEWTMRTQCCDAVMRTQNSEKYVEAVQRTFVVSMTAWKLDVLQCWAFEGSFDRVDAKRSNHLALGLKLSFKPAEMTSSTSSICPSLATVRHLYTSICKTPSHAAADSVGSALMLG